MHQDQPGLHPVLSKIEHWLSPPMFEGDEEKTRIARIAYTLALTVIAILGIYTFARPQLFQENAEAAIANSILLLLLISQLIVIRRGQVRIAVLIITSGAWINLTVQIWLFGGVRDAAFAAYLLIILAASLMVGWRGAALLLLLSILSGFGMAHAEAIGILPFESDNPYALWLDHSLNFAIATILVSMIVTNLNQTLARARRNEQVLAERNSELQAIRTLLEAQIAERKQTEAELERYRVHLEELVEERTAELTRINLRLEAEIAERILAEEQVKSSLQEKEVLLKEIHHRVKNNLQVISSLLNLQSTCIEDRQVLGVLDDSRHRIRSMALIHEKLYQSGNLARVDFGEYIRDLTGYLFRAQSEHIHNVRLNVQTDVVYLNIDMAVPCGLILNELVSNSLKHAFPAGHSGEITITCRADPSDQIILIVSDNGIGFPPELDLQNTGSLGLNLVHLLTEQVSGTLRLDSSQGTAFAIVFPIQGNKVS